MYDERTPVLIVGGSLVGLSSAVFLAGHGVPCLLVERHPDLLIHPRLRGVNPRTMELYRQLGLEPAIMAATDTRTESGDRRVYRVVRAETLASEEYTPVDEGGEDQFTNASPSPFGFIDQDRLEIILRAEAVRRGVDVRFATELTSFTQDADGVTATIRDLRSGQERTIRADYLVAADGWDSPVRNKLGIPCHGPGPIYHTLTAMCEADISAATRGRSIGTSYLQRPRPGTVVLSADDEGRRWTFGTGYFAQQGETLADYPEERVAGLFREAVGLPDLDVKLLPQVPGTDLKVLGFVIGAQVAERYRDGRVFLVGDAAHIVPPTGAFGGSLGIQDAHNLAWKLAAVLRDEAGPALLDTYHDERHPVALFTMGQALAQMSSRMPMVGTGEEPPPLAPYAAVVFGYQYRSAAILDAPDDGTPALPPTALAGQPGTRAPHVWLEREGERLSTLDLFGRHFVLLTGAEDGTWREAARRISDRLGVGIDAHRIGDDGELVDVGGRWSDAYGISPSGAVLVRPDGFVGWRSETATQDPEHALERALSRLLCREPIRSPAEDAVR